MKNEEGKNLPTKKATGVGKKENIPEDIVNALEGLPEKEKNEISKLIMSSLTIRQQGNISPRDQLIGKMNEEHIGQFLTILDRNDEREYKNTNRERWKTIGVIIIGVGMVVFLTLFLAKDNPDIYMNILIALLSFLGGLGAGKLLR